MHNKLEINMHPLTVGELAQQLANIYRKFLVGSIEKEDAIYYFQYFYIHYTPWIKKDIDNTELNFSVNRAMGRFGSKFLLARIQEWEGGERDENIQQKE